MHAPRLDTVVRNGTADVAARPSGQPSVTFVLQRTTPAEASTFDAPSSAWRIADGATAVLHG